MCARLEVNEVRHQPGDKVTVWQGEGNWESLPWVGFARSEILDWWQRHGGELVDIPAGRFAERSDVSDELVWSEIPSGKVVRGLIDHEGEHRVLRVVTRTATASEMLHFQKLRAPMVEEPLYSAAMPPTVGLPLFDVPLHEEEHETGAVQEMLL